MTFPVIKRDWSPRRNCTSPAISFGSPILFRGCLLAELALFSSLLTKDAASVVSVSEGAIQFTRTRGASSAARERVRPSTAPFAAEMLAWKGRPVWTATVEKKTAAAFSPFMREGRAFWRRPTAPSKFTCKSWRKSSAVNLPNGFSVIVPGK